MTDMPDEIYVIPANEQMGIQFVGWDFLSGGTKAKKYVRADLVPQWQLIETAPISNGSNTFLVFIQGHGCCVCYRLKDDVLGLNLFNSSKPLLHQNRITAATHWMPLPQPPKMEE